MIQLDIRIKSRIFRLEASGWQHGLEETDWWVAPQRRRGVLLAANRERWENKKKMGIQWKKTIIFFQCANRSGRQWKCDF